MSEDETFFDVNLGPKNYSLSPACHWKDIFTNEERRFYHAGLFWASVVSLLAMTWLNVALSRTNLRKDDNYRYLTLYTVPAGNRRFLLALSSFFNQTILSTCVFFAYTDSLFGMLEIEGLTHACISRFVMARYAVKGWPMNKRYWEYFGYSTIAFAVFYTFIPLTGYGGSYSYDFTCTTCSYDMFFPDTPERYFIVFLFFMRYIKPGLMMCLMIFWAYCLETGACRDEGNPARKKITWMMTEVTFLYGQCCGLMVAFRFRVIYNQLCNYDYEENILSFKYDAICIEWANWLHALAPVGSVCLMVWRDEKIRHNMLHLRSCKEPAKHTKREEGEEKLVAEKQE